jgi:two-component system, NarL family, nitrate/nitrite response regulator NarL
MANSFSISIMGEERILTEALAIALRTRGVLANAIWAEVSDAASIVNPDVLILASYGSCDIVRARLATARTIFPQAKVVLLAGDANKGLSSYVLEGLGECVLIADSFEKLLRVLGILRNPVSPRVITDERDSIGRFSSDLTGPDSPGLTAREQEIFRSISAGLSNKEIANLFSISPSTVKNHVHNILTKLNMRRRQYALGRTYIPRIHQHRAASASRGDPVDHRALAIEVA